MAALVNDALPGWPELAELRRCAPSTSAAHRWLQALSGLTASARATLDGALMAQRARASGQPLADEVGLAVLVLQGGLYFEAVSLLLDGGLRSVAAVWRMSSERVAVAESRLRLVVGPPAVFGASALPAWARAPAEGPVQPLPLAVLLFGAALRAGWGWALALRLFAGIRDGRVCGKGRGFVQVSGARVPPPELDRSGGWLVSRLVSLTDQDSVDTVYFDYGGIAFVECSSPVFAPRRRPPAAGSGGRVTRFLPSYVRLPTDERGNLVFPRFTVT